MRLANPPAWASPAMIALGLAVAFLEGATLYLFIPLIQSLGAPAGTGNEVTYLFDHLIVAVPADQRIAVLVGAMFIAVVLKNLVRFLNT